VPHHNPSERRSISEFVHGRVRADAQMRAAATKQ